MLFMPGKSQVIWIVSFTFHGLKKYFKNTVLLKDLLCLVQDGHKSQMTVDLIDLARANNVNLPPHTTHATQPVDKNIFKPLKSAFATVLKSVTFACQDYTLFKADFPRFFTEPYDKTSTPFRIKQSFNDAGICPFNSDKIKVDMLSPSEHFQVASAVPIECQSPSTSNEEE